MGNKITQRTILAFAHWQKMEDPVFMGTLSSERIRGKEVFSFEYDQSWLKSSNIYLLDPDLQFFPGPQYLKDDRKPNFGLFLDSSPDRWGRNLMRRREAALARKENREEQALFELDYLIGVYDGYRMGALRFKECLDGPFLSANEQLSIPPWTSIRSLEEISLKLEEDNSVDDPEYLDWLKMLIAPGSSLGGARPKAGMRDTRNHLWIAKFPSKHDNRDVGGWEMVVHELAKNSGIQVAEADARKFSSKYHTFLTKRFDRADHITEFILHRP